MNIKRLVVGQMAANCYLLIDEPTRKAIIVDPGDDGGHIIDNIQKLDVVPTHIIATHGHFDHIMAAYELQQTYAIPFVIHKDDEFLVKRMRETAKMFLGIEVIDPPPKITKTIADSEVIPCGKANIMVIHTPGHTPGSVSFEVQGEGTLLVGDTIFAGGLVGRTDFSYSRPQLLAISNTKILEFPPRTKLLSGHGNETSVFVERPFHLSSVLPGVYT